MPSLHRSDEANDDRRRANLRTAAILISIALVFFGGIIAAQLTGGSAIGIGVLGLAIIGFLLLTVVSKLRRNGAQSGRK